MLDTDSSQNGLQQQDGRNLVTFYKNNATLTQRKEQPVWHWFCPSYVTFAWVTHRHSFDHLWQLVTRFGKSHQFIICCVACCALQYPLAPATCTSTSITSALLYSPVCTLFGIVSHPGPRVAPPHPRVVFFILHADCTIFFDYHSSDGIAFNCIVRI